MSLKVACLTLYVFFSFLCAQPQSIAAPESVQVRLFEAHPPGESIELSGPARVRVGGQTIVLQKGRYVIAIRRDGRLHLRLTAAGKPDLLVSNRLKVLPVIARGVTITNSGRSHTYKGTLDVYADRKNKTAAIAVVNEVSTRDYIASVVGSESQPGCPAEALKAQSVLAATRLVRMLANKKIIGDSTSEQAYLGSQYERPGVREAVEKTWGECVTFDGRPILAFYHATCAGGTSKGVDIFGRGADFPYLAAVQCDNCKESPFWKRTVSKVPDRVFARAMGIVIGRTKRSRLCVPQVNRRDKQQRPTEVKSFCRTGTRLESGYQFWVRLGQKLGWDKAPGTRYWLDFGDDKVEISSTGGGHGVGLCQWGACGLARKGKDYRAIIKYYFPGATVSDSSIL